MLEIISRCTESLRQRFAETQDDPDFIELDGAIDSAFHLARELIGLARPQPTVGPSVLDVNDVVTQVMSVLQRITGPQVQFDVQLNAPPPLVEAEAAQLEWVLFNLISNSRDAMPHGGTVTIRTAMTDPQSMPRQRHYVRLTISDTGRGATEFAQTRVFEPFFTTKEGRSGLGLTSAAMIVRSLKGWLHMESALGVGTTIDIYLPILEPFSR
jgi:two-component system, cell cycle sensor histidine kinase and response regulator CckA